MAKSYAEHLAAGLDGSDGMDGEDGGSSSEDAKKSMEEHLKLMWEACKKGDFTAAADAFRDAIDCDEDEEGEHDEPDGDEPPVHAALLLPMHKGGA